jgi:hypothetical protein
LEKATYYVTVDGSINMEQNLDDAPYDFEVIATDAEIEKLQALYQRAYNQDFATFKVANLPYRTEERMKENKDVDQYVNEIYTTIHRLGSEETRKRIEELGLS